MGELCYLAYIEMIKAWNNEPRWTTAHSIYKKLLLRKQAAHPMTPDDLVAHDLAWQVLFQTHIMPYERMKEKENGTI